MAESDLGGYGDGSQLLPQEGQGWEGNLGTKVEGPFPSPNTCTYTHTRTRVYIHASFCPFFAILSPKAREEAPGVAGPGWVRVASWAWPPPHPGGCAPGLCPHLCGGLVSGHPLSPRDLQGSSWRPGTLPNASLPLSGLVATPQTLCQQQSSWDFLGRRGRGQLGET